MRASMQGTAWQLWLLARAHRLPPLDGSPTHPPILPPSQVLAAGRVEQLAETFGIGAGLAGGGASAPRASSEAAGPQCMALDGAALENLEASAGHACMV